MTQFRFSGFYFLVRDSTSILFCPKPWESISLEVRIEARGTHELDDNGALIRGSIEFDDIREALIEPELPDLSWEDRVDFQNKLEDFLDRTLKGSPHLLRTLIYSENGQKCGTFTGVLPVQVFVRK
jgi:hypothetical protein